MKTLTAYVDIGGRGGTGDIVYVSGFNVEKIVASLMKVDAGTVGQIFAEQFALNFFQPFTNAAHDDAPKLFFGFFPPDNGTTAHESVTGAALTVTGGLGVNISNVPGAPRYLNSWGSLNGNSQAVLLGNNWLTASEAALVSWTWQGWVFYNNALASNIYIESNANVTFFFTLTLNPGGTLSINKAGIGGASYASPAGVIPVGQWIYLTITYDVTNIRVYVNGTLVAGPTAVAHATGNNTDRVIMQQGANGQITTAGVEVYSSVVFSADDIQRHMRYYQNDIVQVRSVGTSATLAINNGVTVIFDDSGQYGWDATNQMLKFPLSSINAIQTGGGVFMAQIDTWERELL